MSKDSAIAYREYVKAHPELEAEMRDILAKIGVVDNVEFAKKYGFEFTETEAYEAWDAVTEDGELSDFELEMVSAGGQYPCNTDDKRFAADAHNRAIDRGV